ncbi:MAG TPA: hypothetical protein VEW07_01270 [Solirubrobacterales bacterium]|nr:hypothetical protein [Solirubrobacterales bacterium]
MYSERLQILISKEQRRRLEAEAGRRKASVASVIRDAVDAELGRGSREDRLRAVAEIAKIKGVPFLPPDELRKAIDEARAEGIDRGFPRSPAG